MMSVPQGSMGKEQDQLHPLRSMDLRDELNNAPIVNCETLPASDLLGSHVPMGTQSGQINT